MADRLRLTILGCGSSPGTPRITGDWGACNPDNPRNRRLRAAALIERIAATGERTTVAIDTGPDFREQMIAAGVRKLDAVVYTHPHADHIHGIDDLRGYFLAQRRRIDIYADAITTQRLREGFEYCFATPEGSAYPPIVEPHLVDHETEFTIQGDGGPLTFCPLPQEHGDIVSLGYRVGPIAYCSDVSGFPPATADLMTGLGLLVIDALQYHPHPSHFALSEALEWVERLKPRHTLLTHMHIPLDYDEVMHVTPGHVEPAYDGQIYEIEIPATEAAE